MRDLASSNRFELSTFFVPNPFKIEFESDSAIIPKIRFLLVMLSFDLEGAGGADGTGKENITQPCSVAWELYIAAMFIFLCQIIP
jgi:hypothetical protein